MLIDTTFFEGEIKIVDLTEQATQTTVQHFIAKHEPEFLRLALGDTLYSAFKTGIQAAEPDQIWIDLRDGVEYTWNDRTYIWRGLVKENVINADLTVKQSPIANYVYCKYVRNLHQQMTSISTVKNKGETSVIVSPEYKLNRAWNEMAEWVRELWDYLYHNRVLYEIDNYYNVAYLGWYGYWPYWFTDISTERERYSLGKFANSFGI